ncbi:hypothetical protein EGI15_11845 [Chryseobacterium cucumeris]|uniref:Uncharacterized protein n=1 Tax=Chryseobacterium cucumeris TaxID=1813611 RepID=A0ABX9X4K8_9FLAO|nr:MULTISPECIES: hypothetical protein [Chryseobacterium]RKE72131.1 hypothetical protein DEU39_4807 [Chryseobacterium sp. AG363]ROH91259.1 hypothetical protein EGI15_11845 [Chryseobacterium cucumeris]
MNRNLIIINLTIILLLAVAYISGYYFLNYPLEFNFRYSLKESGFEYFPAILAVTALITYLVSNLSIKNLSFKAKFLRIYPILNSIILLFFIISFGTELIKKQKELSEKETEYGLQAQKDIQNDQVTLSYAGGFSIPSYNKSTLSKIRDIRKKYGVIYTNTGCIIDPIDLKAQKKYTEIVNPYLEKRNGKGWEDKMQKEIDGLK